MPGSRMVKEWIRADLERVLGQPEKLFIHALSPEVRVPDSGRNDDCDQNRRGDCNPRLPSLCCNFAIGRKRRNFRQYRQLSRIDQILLAANPIIQELGSYAE